MILLFTEPEERETVPCSQCGTMVSVACTGIIDSLPKLRSLLDDTLNTTTCATCGGQVTADVPIWLSIEAHGLEPLFYMPLEYLESGYLDPTTLSDPVNTNQVFYSRNELARQVRARIVIHKLPIGVCNHG